MCVSITILAVMQPDALGNDLPQKIDDVSLHTVIPVFLDHNCGSSSLDIDGDQSILYTAVGRNLFDLLSDIDKLFTGVRGDVNGCSNYLSM